LWYDTVSCSSFSPERESARTATSGGADLQPLQKRHCAISNVRQCRTAISKVHKLRVIRSGIQSISRTIWHNSHHRQHLQFTHILPALSHLPEALHTITSPLACVYAPQFPIRSSLLGISYISTLSYSSSILLHPVRESYFLQLVNHPHNAVCFDHLHRAHRHRWPCSCSPAISHSRHHRSEAQQGQRAV
jgi:hypothetical protein